MKKIILFLLLALSSRAQIVNWSVQLAGGDNAYHAANPTKVPLVRQVVLNTTTGQYKIGDGSTQLQNLPYYSGVLTGSYVPYTGATTSLNLGANSLSVGAISTLSQVVTNTISSNGNNAIYINGNSKRRLEIGPTGVTKIWGDSSTFEVPLIIEGGSSINGTNPDLQLKGYYNGRLRFLNVTTGREWWLQNNIVNGAQKDNFFIGTSSTLGSSAVMIGSLNTVNFADKIRVGSLLTLPSHTLDVTGGASISTTLQVGNTSTLTGGNTGTIAVLSDALFSVDFLTGAGSPADGSTYYMGNVPYGFAASSAANGTVTLPYNCTLVGWNYNAIVNGVVGTAENATIALAGTTNYTLSTTITFSNATIYNGFSGTGLSQDFNANDRLNMKIVCPTWATNPTNIFAGLTLWFVRRK